MSVGNTLNDLKALINSYRSDGEISGPELTDIFRTIANLFEQNNTESLNLAWRADIIYDRPTTSETSGNPSYSEFNDRFWRSKTDNNQNNPPPNDSVTTENTHWIEVSKASSNPITEWTPGIFGNGLVIVFHNDTFYKLNVATRPYESVNIENEISNLDWLEIPSELANKLSKGINTLGIATYLFSEFQFDVRLPNARMDFNDGSLDLDFPNSGFQFLDGAMTIALTGKGFSVNVGDGLYYEDIVGPYKRIFQVPSGDGSTDFRFEFRNKSTNALIQSFVFNENSARYTAPYVGSNPLDIVTREWIQQQIGAIGSGAGQGVHVPVQNITNLKSIDTTNATNYPDKWLINVEDSGLYRYDRESTASEALPPVVSPTTGPGRWIRLTTPLTDHALLDFLQGGAPGEYYHLTASEHAKVSQSVISNPTGVTGADQITNIISLTQAEYDAIASPDASTLYVIT